MTLWRVFEKRKVCFDECGGKSVVESRVKRVCVDVGVKIQDIYIRNTFVFFLCTTYNIQQGVLKS